jgi:hypothetical protein
VYEKKNIDQANNIYNNFISAYKKLGLLVEEPLWYEVSSLANASEFISYVDEDIKAKRVPSIVLFLLPRETYYSALKNACYQRGLLSQCVTFGKAKKFNISIASNVLRQMTVKMGADPFFMAFE